MLVISGYVAGYVAYLYYLLEIDSPRQRYLLGQGLPWRICVLGMCETVVSVLVSVLTIMYNV